MRVVLLDSPGPGPSPHWSVDFAADLAQELQRRGSDVELLPRTDVSRLSPASVTAALTDIPAEKALTDSLRDRRVDAFIHVGLGARGSPNMCWLAQRMGTEAIAVVRTAEVVCQRGDLVDRDGAACGDFGDPERCARCCRSTWRAPHADTFSSRTDLVVVGLQSCRSVWLDAADDAGRLEQVGVPRRTLRTAAAAALLHAVAAEVASVSATRSWSS